MLPITFILLFYFTGFILSKVTCKELENYLNYQSSVSDNIIITNTRLKRADDHVTPEDAIRIRNESSVLVKRLINLGTKTHKMLQNLPERKGDIFLNALAEYNEVFKSFLELIKHDNINTRVDVDRFLSQQHPNIAETDHLEWDARTRFNWADVHYKRFEQEMYKARQMWIDLIYVHTYY